MPSRNPMPTRRSNKSPDYTKTPSSPTQKKALNRRVQRKSDSEDSDCDSNVGEESLLRRNRGGDEPDRSTYPYQEESFHRKEIYDPSRRTECEYPRRRSTVEAERGVRLPKEPSRRDGPTPVITIGFILLLSVSCITLVHYFFFDFSQSLKTGMESKSMETIYKEMERDLLMLNNQLNQNKQLWIQILAQLKLLTEEKTPLHPAILLGLVPLDSRRTAACLSQQILTSVATAFDDRKYIAFDSESHNWNDVTALKHDIHDALTGLNESHAAAIFNLEKLDPEAMMAFHAFCDNENAPHKRALILLTMGIDQHYSSLSPALLDSTVTRHLSDLLTQKLREDDASAIVSRISNAPILFKPEKAGVIGELCPF